MGAAANPTPAGLNPSGISYVWETTRKAVDIGAHAYRSIDML